MFLNAHAATGYRLTCEAVTADARAGRLPGPDDLARVRHALRVAEQHYQIGSAEDVPESVWWRVVEVRSAAREAAAAVAVLAGRDPVAILSASGDDEWLALTARLDAMAAETASSVRVPETAPRPSHTPGEDAPATPSINARMRDAAERDYTRQDWSCRQWAAFLGCNKDTVINQPFWRELSEMKEAAKALRKARDSGVSGPGQRKRGTRTTRRKSI